MSCPLTTMDSLAQMRVPRAHSPDLLGWDPGLYILTGTWANQPGTALQGEVVRAKWPWSAGVVTFSSTCSSPGGSQSLPASQMTVQKQP